MLHRSFLPRALLRTEEPRALKNGTIPVRDGIIEKPIVWPSRWLFGLLDKRAFTAGKINRKRGSFFSRLSDMPTGKVRILLLISNPKPAVQPAGHPDLAS